MSDSASIGALEECGDEDEDICEVAWYMRRDGDGVAALGNIDRAVKLIEGMVIDDVMMGRKKIKGLKGYILWMEPPDYI